MNRRTLLLALGSLALLSCLASAPVHAAQVDVWIPRGHAPAFAEPGKSFTAEIRGVTNPAGTWTAEVRNDLRSWTCSVSAAAGRIHHGSEDGCVLTITVPVGTPPELLDLVVTHGADGSDTSTRALRVVSNLESDFYIMHMSDQHIISNKAGVADGRTAASGGAGSSEAMGWAAPVVNLINPRFLTFTGDNQTIYWTGSYGPVLATRQNYLSYFTQAMDKYAVATIPTLGNHDLGWGGGASAGIGTFYDPHTWHDYYQNTIGQSSSSFRMGSFYVIGNEWTYTGEWMPWLDWAKSDYANAYANPAITYRLLLQHYYNGTSGVAGSAPSGPGLTPVPSNKPCNLALGGHTHGTGKLGGLPYPFLLVGTAMNYQKAGCYQFQKSGSTWTCPQVASHAEGVNVFNLVGDWGTPKVSLAFAATNDGTKTSNTATIVSALPMTFGDGRVRFLMNKGNYTITGGTAVATYDYASGTKTAVDVKVTITRNATTTVKITTSGSTAVAPAITTQPANKTVTAGQTTTFSVAASGSPAPTYQWQKNGANISGATAASYTTPATVIGDNGATFRCVASNSAGTATSNSATLIVNANPVIGNGTGLSGTYFNNPDFTGATALRTDAKVDFTWASTAAPISGITAESYSVRWAGQVQAPYSQTYTFSATADDGVRLWVNGKKLIDQWKDQAATEYSGTIALTAGTKYDLVLEYYQGVGSARIALAWSSPLTTKQIVPSAQLYPATVTGPWTATNLSNGTPAGSSYVSGSTVVLTSAIGDIWNNADGGSFLGQPLTGDGTIVAKVASIENTNAWAKAGVMIRENTSTGARHAFCCVTSGNGVAFQRRTVVNGPSAHTAGSRSTAPRWVKLVRAGTTLTGYESADGVTWTVVGTTTIGLGNPVQIGVAVASLSNTLQCTAVFELVQITPAGAG